MTDIFPMTQPEALEESEDFPIYREVKWDYEKNIPVFSAGAPVIVEEQEAVLSWAFRALNTIRGRYEIYTDDYGCELDTLIGQEYSSDLKLSEAQRFVEECLLINPYIDEVAEVAVDFEEDRMTVTATMSTRYGEVDVNV